MKHQGAKKERKLQSRVVVVGLIMAASILTVVLVAWLLDGRDPENQEQQSRVGQTEQG